MMTRHELTRVRRQMHQRIRLTLVQRRVDARLAADPAPEPPSTPEPVAEQPPSAEEHRRAA